MSKTIEDVQPVIGIPYYNGNEKPYEAGLIPPNALMGDPKGIPIQQTIYRDTPAPFFCSHCATSALTIVSCYLATFTGGELERHKKSKPSLAAVVACMMPVMLGFCFLCPSMDCLWHKYHYCPTCNEKVADFEKPDLCAVMDPSHWTDKSFALPA